MTNIIQKSVARSRTIARARELALHPHAAPKFATPTGTHALTQKERDHRGLGWGWWGWWCGGGGGGGAGAGDGDAPGQLIDIVVVVLSLSFSLFRTITTTLASALPSRILTK